MKDETQFGKWKVYHHCLSLLVVFRFSIDLNDDVSDNFTMQMSVGRYAVFEKQPGYIMTDDRLSRCLLVIYHSPTFV